LAYLEGISTIYFTTSSEGAAIVWFKILNFRNVSLKSDHKGNVKPNKSIKAKKIDGAISMIQALGMYLTIPHYTNEIMTI